MKKTIIFPCDPLDHRHPDPEYAHEFGVAKMLGYETLLLDFDALVSSGEVSIPGTQKFEHAVDGMFQTSLAFYRGWMMDSRKYEKLYEHLKMNHVMLLTSSEEYSRCHYFPEVYESIKDFTPRAVWLEDSFSNIETSLHEKAKELGTDMFMKDYTKSNKELGINRISKDVSKEELLEITKRFMDGRGKLFNRGIVLKEFVDLMPDEWRVFVVKKHAVTQFLRCRNNVPAILTGDAPFDDERDLDEYKNAINELKGSDEPPLALVREVADRIKATFFTMDFGRKKDGTWIVLEVGDGQVSGLSPGQNPIGLFNILNT